MTVSTENPFTPIEVWHEATVAVDENGEERSVDAKHYHVRFVVGESQERRLVDRGAGATEEVQGRVLYVSPSIHLIPGEPYHYDHNEIENIIGRERIERSRTLRRADQCESHKLVEVSFVSPVVECCSLSEEQARQTKVPVKYIAGYLISREDGVFRVALNKTVLDSGQVFYDNVHVIPESAIQSWSCLE